MKTKLFIVAIICGWLLLFFFTSCKKEKDLGPLYESFIGTWRPVYGDVGDYIEFTKNGHFIYSRGTERQVDFKVNTLKSAGTTLVNNIEWERTNLVFQKKNNSSSVTIVYNQTQDTIRKYTIKKIDDLGEYDFTSGIQFFVRK